MSDEIKELAKRLRHSADTINQPGGILLPSDWRDAADALEALTEERDRLKDALVRLRDCDWVITLPDRMDGVRQIAREALEGREWERLGSEKVSTHGTPELDEDARKLAAMGQDPGATFATDPAPAVCEWASIETAPKDGALICGAWMHGRRWETRALHWNGHDWECPTEDWYYDPTHWMPLPPPEAKE